MDAKAWRVTSGEWRVTSDEQVQCLILEGNVMLSAAKHLYEVLCHSRRCFTSFSMTVCFKKSRVVLSAVKYLYDHPIS